MGQVKLSSNCPAASAAARVADAAGSWTGTAGAACCRDSGPAAAPSLLLPAATSLLPMPIALSISASSSSSAAAGACGAGAAAAAELLPGTTRTCPCWLPLAPGAVCCPCCCCCGGGGGWPSEACCFLRCLEPCRFCACCNGAALAASASAAPAPPAASCCEAAAGLACSAAGDSAQPLALPAAAATSAASAAAAAACRCFSFWRCLLAALLPALCSAAAAAASSSANSSAAISSGLRSCWALSTPRCSSSGSACCSKAAAKAVPRRSPCRHCMARCCRGMMPLGARSPCNSSSLSPKVAASSCSQAVLSIHSGSVRRIEKGARCKAPQSQCMARQQAQLLCLAAHCLPGAPAATTAASHCL